MAEDLIGELPLKAEQLDLQDFQSRREEPLHQDSRNLHHSSGTLEGNHQLLPEAAGVRFR